MTGPLSDLRVVDVTASLAGAYGARLLADLGAEVVRVQGTRDLAHRLCGREVPPWEPGLHHVVNAGKGAVALTLDAREGAQGLQDLLRGVNLLIEDVGLLDGDAAPLSWSEVQALNPALTAVSVSPFGSWGPYAGYPASDLTLWAWSGLAWATPGVPDTPRDLAKEPPLAPTGVSIAGLMTGAVVAVAALATLSHRDGRGRRVEISQHEALAALNYHPVAQYEYLRRLGPRGPNVIARQPNCYVPCQDGWLVLVAMSPQHWDALVEAMGSPEWALSSAFADAASRAANWDALEPLLTEWTVAHTGREITQELQARGLPVYWSATLREAVASEQVAARRFLQRTTDPEGRDLLFPGLPFILSDFPRHAEGEERTAKGVRPSDGSPLPLAGVRVLDFGQYIAVPFAARWLAALGADVIQVESRQNPFDYRRVPPFADDLPGLNRAAGYNVLNAGKRSISLNLRTERGREIARRLAAQCDVLLENYSTGTMERWGLGYEHVAALNPRLVYISVAAFGRTGPLSDYGGLHSIVNAFSGLADVTGYPGGHPRLLGSYFPDVVSATYAVLASLAALRDRQRTGRGQFVDLAMTECLMTLLVEPILTLSRDGREPSRLGNRHPRHAPHNVYPCTGEDRWVAVAVRTSEEWRALCSLLGRADWPEDPRYGTAAARKGREDEIDAAIAAWTRPRTAEEAAMALIERGVPAAPCLDPQELVDDPHLTARGLLAPVDHPEVGPRRAAGLPWLVEGVRPGSQRPAPLLGQYGPSILRDLLDLAEAEVQDLQAAGILT